MVDGISFRSTLEADCYQLLKSWRDAGAINNLELQPKFLLQCGFRRGGPVDGEWVRPITYRADFAFEIGQQEYVVEAKGFRTQPYILRRKLFLGRYPDLRFLEWTRDNVGEGVSFNGKVFE